MTNSTTCEENERMLCGHCGVKTPIRREGNSGTVKYVFNNFIISFLFFFFFLILNFKFGFETICRTCDWCGKVLADETGTVEEYNELFLRLQYFQNLVSKFKKNKATTY